MNQPKRIQRKRTKGWRMPPGTIYVGRPSSWGNPYRATDRDLPWCGQSVHLNPRATNEGDLIRLAPMGAIGAAYHFRLEAIDRASRKDGWLDSLRGKDLACWCPLDQPCHADVLLELANA